MIADYANVYFTVFIIVLLFFFLDSIREMMSYSKLTSADLGQEIQIHVKLFRSQRNYFISGFAVFLWLVIRRLVMLLLTEADLLTENESSMKRAQNATETVEKILRKKEEMDKETSLSVSVSMKEINDLRNKVEEAQNELNRTKESVKDVKEKSLSVSKEYEGLLERHTALMNESKRKEELRSLECKKDEDCDLECKEDEDCNVESKEEEDCSLESKEEEDCSSECKEEEDSSSAST